MRHGNRRIGRDYDRLFVHGAPVLVADPVVIWIPDVIVTRSTGPNNHGGELQSVIGLLSHSAALNPALYIPDAACQHGALWKLQRRPRCDTDDVDKAILREQDAISELKRSRLDVDRSVEADRLAAVGRDCECPLALLANAAAVLLADDGTVDLALEAGSIEDHAAREDPDDVIGV